MKSLDNYTVPFVHITTTHPMVLKFEFNMNNPMENVDILNILKNIYGMVKEDTDRIWVYCAGGLYYKKLFIDFYINVPRSKIANNAGLRKIRDDILEDGHEFSCDDYSVRLEDNDGSI